MKVPRYRSSKAHEKDAPPVANDTLVMTGVEFLLSMVESRWASRNGDSGKPEPGERTHKELAKIDQQIARLQDAAGPDENTLQEIQQLRDRVEALRKEMTSHFGAWEKTELARHPQRPYALDYIDRIFTDWSELHGDRGFGDDPALVCGMARFHGEPVMIVGHQKARDTKQKVYRNFGMPNPEGYRKALRVMKIAEKFQRPVITPITGEGGSGGALAIAVADRVLMMENAVYSVISPEGCASIMWRDAAKKALAAEAMKITAKDLNELGCIDGIIPEPAGGAHTDHAQAAEFLDRALQQHLAAVKRMPVGELLETRYKKFRDMAQFFQAEV